MARAVKARFGPQAKQWNAFQIFDRHLAHIQLEQVGHNPRLDSVFFADSDQIHDLLAGRPGQRNDDKISRSLRQQIGKLIEIAQARNAPHRG